MPFTRLRGRFRRRYPEFDDSRNEATRLETPVLTPDSHLVDIADAHFNNARLGTVRVTCWPSPEGEDPGRRWGKYRSIDAAVVPFRTTAYLSTATQAEITTYELEVFICNSEADGSRPFSFSQPCPGGQHGQSCNVHSDVSLVELPAPKHMNGGSRTRSRHNETSQLWKLRSETGCSCGSSAKAAKWIWVANGHDPVVWHGGLAIQHTGSPFRMACRTRGHVAVKYSNFRIGTIFKFDNDKRGLKWWQIEPKESHEDISAVVKELENEIKRLNTEPVRTHSPNPSPGPLIRSVAEGSRSSNQNYATTAIGGSANVVLGNVTYMNSPELRVSQTAIQQASQNTSLTLPETTLG